MFTEFFTGVLNGLYGITETLGFPSYALAIILLTVVIKVILFPLTLKQMRSMRGMQEVQPEIEKIQKKYKNDKEKLNKAMLELYQTYDVNPAAGCLPLIIQMPILIGLFRTLKDFNFESVENVGFFWISNLGQPDPWMILPVLVALATFMQSKMSMPKNAPTQNAALIYFMPIFIGWISMRFPAGLALYWVVFNALGAVQQLIINRQPLAKKGEVSGK